MHNPKINVELWQALLNYLLQFVTDSFAIVGMHRVKPVFVAGAIRPRLNAVKVIGFRRPEHFTRGNFPIPGPGVGSPQGQPQQLFILPQGLFSPLAVGNIPPGGDEPIP